jgi:hypothetical protein
MTAPLAERDRFLRTLRYQPVDARPLHLVGPWPDTVARWRREGLPADVADVHAHLGLNPLRVSNITPRAGLFPPFASRVLREDADTRVSIDGYGRTVLEFKDHTSMPEWLEFPVKSPDDLRRVLDEHFDVTDLDARFPPDWEARARAAAARGDLILIDGGCYYWTLRSLAGVDGASYLLYDAPELVDELCERYFTVVMEGLRRAVRIVSVDLVGFGEDIGFKTGPLLSPDMFRRFILPRYRRAMEFAQVHGVDLTWYDSDGDIRLFIPDYLEAGINTLAPCEVAAGMDPVELRRRFGKGLRLIGGFDKRIVARGPAAIAAEFARLRPVLDEGGFVPAIDHSVPADVSWSDYRAFLDQLLHALGRGAWGSRRAPTPRGRAACVPVEGADGSGSPERPASPRETAMATPPPATLTIFFPMWNEEDGLDAAVDAARQIGDALLRDGDLADYEILIVDDASTDRTGLLADARARQNPRVRCVHHRANRGLGGALKTGFAQARGELVLYTDADLPCDLAELRTALRLGRLEDADVVSAYRRSRLGDGTRRLLYSLVYNSLVRTLFGLRVRDVNFGFKLCRASLFRRLSLSSDGSFIDAELLARTVATGGRISQFGVDYHPRTRGTSTLGRLPVIVHLLRELVALYPELRRARSRPRRATVAAGTGQPRCEQGNALP